MAANFKSSQHKKAPKAFVDGAFRGWWVVFGGQGEQTICLGLDDINGGCIDWPQYMSRPDKCKEI